MKIVPIIKPKAACDYHRLELPLHYLGIDVNPQQTLPVLLQDAEVVVFNRWAGFPIEHLLRAKKKYGFKIVCDIDDYFELYSTHVNYKSWNEANMKQNILEALFNSDMVFASTAKLAGVLSKFNKKVEVIPNGLPFDIGQFTDNQQVPDKFEILYAGGTSHFWDLLSLKNLFYKIAREKVRKNLRVSLAGYSDKTPETKKFWEAMESIMNANKRLDFKRRNGLPLHSYMDLYNGASVAIAPLEGNYFNSFKSNLKILEAGCKNIPIITSDVSPYSDEPTDLILKATSINDWYNHIKRLVDEPHYATDLGHKLGEYVRENYDIFKINQKRKQIFEHLCSI